VLGVGIDWAEEFHLVALGSPGEGVTEIVRVEHRPAAVAAASRQEIIDFARAQHSGYLQRFADLVQRALAEDHFTAPKHLVRAKVDTIGYRPPAAAPRRAMTPSAPAARIITPLCGPSATAGSRCSGTASPTKSRMTRPPTSPTAAGTSP
jgi:hypothetical protein